MVIALPSGDLPGCSGLTFCAQLCTVGACKNSVTWEMYDGDQLVQEERRAYPDGELTAPYFGVVEYINGPELDKPLAVIDVDQQVHVLNPNWRGTFESSVTPMGGGADCSLLQGSCQRVAWPAGQAVYQRPLPIENSFSLPITWMGSLLTDQQDGTGHLFRRNRYFDPDAGRFTQEDPAGLTAGANLYAFAGGDPVNYSDPFGLCPSCVGAITGVAEGFILAKLLGQEYTWKDAAVDAALGAVGAGLADKLYELSKAARGAEAAEEGLGVVYRRLNPKTGETYIGRSKSEGSFLRRQSAHDSKLRVKHEYEIIDRAANGSPLRAAEESAIRQNGGPGKLANRRYEMNDQAYRAAGGTVPRP
jgi:RHS repeat-associated protein